MLGDLLTRLLVLILGYAYPAFECFKSVEKNKVGIDELRFWCQYWILVAFLIVFERLGEVLISWLPMYGEAKVALLVYLWYPKTKGSTYVYDTLFRPFMARHETEVDRKIQEAKARAWDFLSKYFQIFAEMGQGKFFEMLQYLANQSTKFKQANQDELINESGQTGYDFELEEPEARSGREPKPEPAEEVGSGRVGGGSHGL